jgi:hypothetical protein
MMDTTHGQIYKKAGLNDKANAKFLQKVPDKTKMPAFTRAF